MSRKLKSSTGRRISEKLEGGGEAEKKRKVFSIFLNEVTLLAVLRLTSSEFQVEGAATAKALDSILFENVEQLTYLCWKI